jgi:hypothetical protein
MGTQIFVKICCKVFKVKITGYEYGRLCTPVTKKDQLRCQRARIRTVHKKLVDAKGSNRTEFLKS